MTFIYPRLRPIDANEQFESLDEQFIDSGIIPFDASYRHPKAYYPSASAAPVLRPRLSEIHLRLAQFVPAGGLLSPDDKRQFDIQAGKLFVEVFEEDGQAQAADEEVWAFLGLVAFPDIVLARFKPPKGTHLSPERFKAGRRNAFYAPYIRALVLGDLLDDPDTTLLEDELVGIMDRGLSMDHRLVQSIARSIHAMGRGSNRREAVRGGLKEIRFRLLLTEYSAFSDEELDAEVNDIMRPLV